MEVLILIVLLGISAATVIPSMKNTGSLRVQGALRMIVADMSLAQSDAVAFQQGRAIVFNFQGDPARYAVATVVGNTIDTTPGGIIADRKFGGSKFGFATLSTSTVASDTVIFDPLGGPVDAPGSTNPAAAGYLEVSGSGQTYRINVEAYTGRVTIQRL